MLGFVKFLIHFGRHKWPGCHAQIIAKANNVHHIPKRFNDFLKTFQMYLHQSIQKLIHLIRIHVRVHQEIIHTS